MFAIADARGVDPETVTGRPLAEVVDPEALEHLFDTNGEAVRVGMETVEFEYAEFSVIVGRDGWIEVHDT